MTAGRGATIPERNATVTYPGGLRARWRAGQLLLEVIDAAAESVFVGLHMLGPFDSMISRTNSSRASKPFSRPGASKTT